jgi:DNA-directed RNA polymerase specialized sigma24 family protein
MRGIVIDSARRRRALKHGAGVEIIHLDEHLADNLANEPEIFRIDEAVEELTGIDSSLAQLVELRYFSGLSLAEIGALQGLTERTMRRKWEKARLLLFSLLTHDDPHRGG